MTNDSTIYLDHNATAPLLPEVVDAMAAALRQRHANPASQHEPGRQARRQLEAARERIVELLGGTTSGMRADKLVFTSGVPKRITWLFSGSPKPLPRRAIRHIS